MSNRSLCYGRPMGLGINYPVWLPVPLKCTAYCLFSLSFFPLSFSLSFCLSLLFTFFLFRYCHSSTLDKLPLSVSSLPAAADGSWHYLILISCYQNACPVYLNIKISLFLEQRKQAYEMETEFVTLQWDPQDLLLLEGHVNNVYLRA